MNYTKEKNLIYNGIRKNKLFGINLTKNVSNLYTEKYGISERN